ncbi:MAG: hypothetical protein KIC54_07145 [Clostridium sp.]|nr:hypothetical protein [Clostridium sp.]
MPKHHEKTTYVSEISAMIEAFIRKPPESVDSDEALSIEAKLSDITKAVRDLLEDEELPDVQDMLKAYRDQVKELTQGQA